MSVIFTSSFSIPLSSIQSCHFLDAVVVQLYSCLFSGDDNDGKKGIIMERLGFSDEEATTECNLY